MKIVFLCILSFFAMVGLAYCVFALYLKLVNIKDDSSIIVITKLENSLDPEFYIRSVIAKAKRSFGLDIKRIIIINNNFDEKTKREIALVCKGYDYISVMTKEDFKATAEF